MENYPKYETQSGQWNNNYSGGANETRVVTFPYTFNSIPTVIFGSLYEAYVSTEVTDINPGGFSVKIKVNSVLTANVQFYWTATAEK